jgi:hypothetical protein
MTLGEIPENRRELDRALRALQDRERDDLLDKLGPARRAGLRVWYFGGPSALDQDPREIPLGAIREFARRYASMAV